MTITFKIRNHLPSHGNVRITLSPQVGNFMGSLAARCTGHLMLDEATESKVVGVLSLTPDEAFRLARELVKVHDAAVLMLAKETGGVVPIEKVES